jgi:Polysaccharide deacetylase
LTKKEKKILYDYAGDGGAIITEANGAKSVFNIDLKYSYLKFLYSESDKLFDNYLICDLYNWSKIAKNGNHLENQDKEKSVLSFSAGKGNVIVFPDGFAYSVHRNGVIRKNFYSAFSNEFSSEIVSKVSKGAIRIHIQKALEFLFHKRNLPFVHLWFFPDAAKNIFSFRVDTDMGTEDEILSLNNLLQNYNIPATWFVETKSSGQMINLFSDLHNQEIAFHCFRHKTFLSYQKNEEDVNKGLGVLKNEGINPKGYAAPYGKWNKTIAEVTDHFNFLYSSEFGFAYDSLPLYPHFNSSFSQTLQIPIHPVSVGRLHWGGHSEENMANYFYNIIEQKLFFDEPIILYTHPFEKRLKVFEKVFERIKELQKIPNLTFLEYAEWWKKRLNVNFSAEEKEGKVFVYAENKDDSVKCRISYPSGEKTLLPLSDGSEIKMTKINYEPKSFNPDQLRKRTFRMVKYDIIGKLRKLKQ